jgi:hypothetical protein
VAGDILAWIGDETATRVLIEWLRNSDEHARTLAFRWMLHATSPLLLQAGRAMLASVVSFQAEEVRAAIRNGLAEYERTHASSPPGVSP